MPRLLILFNALILAALLSCCAHTLESEPAKINIDIPETYSLYEGSTTFPDRWWEGFDSDELNRLIDDALQGNLDLKVALARLEQSRALAAIAGADRSPDLNLSATASETRQKAGGQVSNNSVRSLSFASTYEIDFWGRVNAQHRSALMEVEASREDLFTSAMTLASEITLKWLETLSVRQQLALLDEQLETNKTILELLELRYLKGFATALDIYQQRQIVAETTAVFPGLEGRLRTLLNDLAVLTGKPPLADLGLDTSRFPEIGEPPGTGVPADLLARRPDIRAAGFSLRASEEKVAAARAGRLPALNLSATAGFSADSFVDLLDNWFTTLAANLTWPLFNSGELDAEVERRLGVVNESLAVYQRTVLDAIREVEDALILERKQMEYIAGLEEQLAIAKDSFREAQQRYRKGLIDYLPALSALISAQRFERTVVQAKLERLNQRVKLHRALGGSWMSEEFK